MPQAQIDHIATTIPTWPDPIIGRDADRARLRALLIDGGHRLVTITGPGGIGKTRLAAQIATDLAASFRDGACFLPLAPVSPDADIDAAVAWRLDLRDAYGLSHRDAIVSNLRERELLLVVDNAEHLPTIADLLATISAQCIAVTILVTSRRTLGLYGEMVHHLDPLAHRQPSLLPAAGSAAPTHSDAITLFLARARAAAPAFDVTSDNTTAIAAICDALGGLPLAIEVTAPRVAHQTPALMLAELEHVAAGSVHATIRLSYDRLDVDARRVFRTLCIMRGQWSIDDILPILPPGIDELAAIDLLDTLVTSSLVASPPHPHDEHRFTINPVLRQVGCGLLAEHREDRAVADRHATHMVELAEAAEPELTGSGQQQWLARLEALHDDLRAAHTHLRATGQEIAALRLATALWRFAYIRGHYREALRMLAGPLDVVAGHDALRCHALNGLGMLANLNGDPQRSRTAYQHALALAMTLDLDRQIAISRIGLADIEASGTGDTDSALRHLAFASEAYARLDDIRGMASVLTNRGYIEWQLGTLDRAFATHEEARALYATMRDTRGISWSDMNTGRIATGQGRYHEAVPRLRAGLDGYVQLGDAGGVAEALEAFAAVAVATGDRSGASTLLGAATALRERIGAMPLGLDREERDATYAAVREDDDHDAAFARGTRMDPEAAIAAMRAFHTPPPPPTATPPDARQRARATFGITGREHDVLVLLADGKTNREIGEQLALSPRTVQTHVQSLFHKLEVNSRGEAAHAARQAGILPPPATA